MSRGRLHLRLWGVLLGVAALAVAIAWAAAPSYPAALPLAAMLPQGALMTVESADFGALVNVWNRSPEQRAWLSSASYSAFTDSRLFARLQDAQSGFAKAAKRNVDGGFLAEVAGKESIFAWYDIGNLEFLYISRLPPDRLAKLSLLAERSSFARREAGGTTFYIRTSTANSPAEQTTAPQDAADPGDVQASSDSYGVQQARTVAFAVRGDLLLLGTREDLIAGALQLLAQTSGTNAGTASQATEGWYAAATAAGPAQHGDLHMLLDLQALTKTPQFRTYWIQRNITGTRQYRAAVVDLYREPGQFREERVLLPMHTGAEQTAQSDLGSLEQMVPQRADVYRAFARPQSADALRDLLDKVLVRGPAEATDEAASPQALTTVTPAGSAGDFDTRIDAPQRALAATAQPFAALQGVLEHSGLESMLTLDRTDPPAAANSFVRIHSAVVLRSTSAWNKDALSAAVLSGLQPRLTTSSLGLRWTPATVAAREYLRLGAAAPVCLSVEGPLAIISSDPTLMEDLLQRHTTPQASTMQARELAGFRHDQERANFRHLTASLNVTQTALASPETPATASSSSSQVDLFRDNLPSLSSAFQEIAFEHFAETREAGNVHQRVLYRLVAP